ncbi:NirD/YgiW/YdeI family stress tolerance protein [Shewanella surugensis]|uniref:NirD/YgiW/YdeI family stress tolerance protein n=1 Tax=Shewanella surugensis TaxID=212020 RepID=A0ABT0LA86_9GAMM|nr:NirD/YgiW/YdeI family stress tolerance protein [Shewanella surugensis]MCL1124395.1 NirD/YgiW/YdeI family stress tolerance protein [Shewanella surugensis]
MTKTLAGSIILTCVLTLPANADNNQPEVRFKSSDSIVNKGASVTFSGYLVKSLDDGSYLFRDNAGDVEVEIKNTLWRDMEVSDNNQVTLIGQKEDRWKGIEIEIDSARLI